LEAIAKKLEAQEVANISSNGEIYDFCEKAYESGACLPESYGLSEDQVKYMGVYTRKKRNPYSNNYNFGWPNHQQKNTGRKQ
jgi:hypothetical protein